MSKAGKEASKELLGHYLQLNGLLEHHKTKSDYPFYAHPEIECFVDSIEEAGSLVERIQAARQEQEAEVYEAIIWHPFIEKKETLFSRGTHGISLQEGIKEANEYFEKLDQDIAEFGIERINDTISELNAQAIADGYIGISNPFSRALAQLKHERREDKENKGTPKSGRK